MSANTFHVHSPLREGDQNRGTKNMSATPSIFLLSRCNCVVANFFKLLPRLFFVLAEDQHFWSQLMFPIQLQHELSEEHSDVTHNT